MQIDARSTASLLSPATAALVRDALRSVCGHISDAVVMSRTYIICGLMALAHLLLSRHGETAPDARTLLTKVRFGRFHRAHFVNQLTKASVEGAGRAGPSAISNLLQRTEVVSLSTFHADATPRRTAPEKRLRASSTSPVPPGLAPGPGPGPGPAPAPAPSNPDHASETARFTLETVADIIARSHYGSVSDDEQAGVFASLLLEGGSCLHSPAVLGNTDSPVNSPDIPDWCTGVLGPNNCTDSIHLLAHGHGSQAYFVPHGDDLGTARKFFGKKVLAALQKRRQPVASKRPTSSMLHSSPDKIRKRCDEGIAAVKARKKRVQRLETKVRCFLPRPVSIAISMLAAAAAEQASLPCPADPLCGAGLGPQAKGGGEDSRRGGIGEEYCHRGGARRG